MVIVHSYGVMEQFTRGYIPLNPIKIPLTPIKPIFLRWNDSCFSGTATRSAGLITLVELEERMEAREPNGEVWVNFSTLWLFNSSPWEIAHRNGWFTY